MFGIDTRIAQAVWTVAVIAGLLYGIYAIRSTLLVLVLAVFFSYVVYPLVELTQRRVGPRVPRDVVISIVFTVVVGAILLAVIAFGSKFADEMTALTQEMPRLLDPEVLSKRLPLPNFLEPFRDHLAALFRRIFQAPGNQELPVTQQIGSSVLGFAAHLVYIVVIPIISFLLVRQAPVLKAQILSWGSKSSRRLWATLADDVNFLLSRYVRALLLLSLAALVVYSVVLSLFGVPFALLLGGIASLLEVIPVIGPAIGAILILAVASFNGYGHIWWLLAFLAAYRIFQDYLLNPYLMKQGVKVEPVLVVLGLLAGSEVAGITGIFLSVPFLALVKITAYRLRHTDAVRK